MTERSTCTTCYPWSNFLQETTIRPFIFTRESLMEFDDHEIVYSIPIGSLFMERNENGAVRFCTFVRTTYYI
jgi:hypothetical protein